MRKLISSVLEIVEVALVAIGTVFLIRNFLFQPFLVSGASMVPNYSDGDYLLIDELTYRLRSPERGEVVVFRYPKDETTYFIKRIIALPGERVTIEGDAITVFAPGSDKGTVLHEEYLSPSSMTGGYLETTLAAGEYFVLGDNRSFSYDSRNWGTLHARYMVGLARLRLWPLTEIRAFAAPLYQ